MRQLIIIVGAILVAFGFLGMIIGAASNNKDMILFFALAAVVGTIMWTQATDQAFHLPKHTRPIVHVWEHDGITRVMPDIDYELACQIQNRVRLAELGGGKPDSEIIIQFSDRYLGMTGKMEDYGKLVKDCDVRRSEMQIRYNPALTFPTAWKLVHGADSKPPEE